MLVTSRELKMQKYFVYMLCDPRKPDAKYESGFEPFYIGKGSGRRISDHFREARDTTKNSPKLNKIRKIQSEGLEPIAYIISCNLSNDDALLLEIKMISLFGRKDTNAGPLLNLTDGGDGTIHIKIKQSTKNKISAKLKDAHTAGKFRNAQQKLLGKSRSDETKQKIKNSLIGKSFSDERKMNIKLGMQNYLDDISNKQKYLVIDNSNNPYLTILSHEGINHLGFSSLYTSYRKNRPLRRGIFKGWSLIKV